MSVADPRRQAPRGGAAEATSSPFPLSMFGKVRLLLRIWSSTALVLVLLRRHGLPKVVVVLGKRTATNPYPPRVLSRAVSRGLRIGRWQPRCLIRSLVLFRLLREQGDSADLIIGLPNQPHSPDAHAWVELNGTDLGPMPGRGRHVEFARYPYRS